MKKTLLALACLGTVLSASAVEKTDVFTLEDLQLEGLMAGYKVGYYNEEGASSGAFEFEAASGITYRVSGIYLGSKQDTFSFYYDKGYITNVSNPAGLYLKSVEFETEYGWGNIYGRQDAVGYHKDINDFDIPNVGYDYDTYTQYPGNTRIEENGSLKFPAEEPFGYVVVVPGAGYDYCYTSVKITWTDVAPVPQVKKPELRIYPDASGAYVPGCKASIYSQTDGSQLHYTVEVNGVLKDSFDQSKDDDNYYVEYELDGNVGDKYLIKAWGTKDGYTDSEVAESEVTLTLPAMMAPGGDFGEYAYFQPVKGSKGELTNPNHTEDGDVFGTLHYTVNGESFTSTEEKVEITVTGEVGDPFVVSSYISYEGYSDSKTVTFNGEVIDNHLREPWMEPSTDIELKAGQKIEVGAGDCWMAKELRYRVNGGEWISTTNSSENYVTPAEGATEITVEAQLIADTEGEYSYYLDSEIVSNTWKIEVIGETMHVILPSHFAEKNPGDHTDLDATIKNVEWHCKSGINHYNWYFDYGANSDDHITNKTEIPGGVYAVKLDFNRLGTSEDHMIIFSNEPFDYVAEEEFDYNNHVLFGGADEATQKCTVKIDNSDNGKWIYLTDYDRANGTDTAGMKYMFVHPDNNAQWSQLSRMVLDTDPTISGVETVGAEAAVSEGVYNLNGMRVNSETLLPGVYVKVAGGKAVKFVVK